VGGMRYIFTKEIWPLLAAQDKGKDNEIWVADAANSLAKKKPFFAYEYEGTYFDTGDKVALLKTAIHFALKDESIKSEIKNILQSHE
jgi:UTP--glucose-1-phosphate uridylyltransferase